jgi:hypothetical protein
MSVSEGRRASGAIGHAALSCAVGARGAAAVPDISMKSFSGHRGTFDIMALAKSMESFPSCGVEETLT